MASGLDVLENAAILTFVALYPSDVIAPSHAALSAITVVKFALLATGFLSFFALLVVYFRRDRAR